jgi:oxygen-dependent protoporphyrinogen oxidase
VLRREADRWVVEAGGVDGPIAARAVILAAPAFVAADLLAPIDAEAARICAEVEYVSTASVALAWRKSDVPHPLQGTGFVVARRHSDVRITACTWVSSKWAQRAPEGMALLRVFLGGAHDPAVVDLNDEAIAGIARRDLETTLGITAPPALARVFRWRRAGAQHTVGQPARSDALDRALARHTGLFVAGSGFRSVGIPDCIAEARAVAARAYTMWP